MKKFFVSLMMLALVCAGAAFTACDDDVYDAEDLSGEWEGNMGMYYIDNQGYEYDAYNTYIAFYPDYEYATHGYGEEIDYFSRDCPIYCQNFYFEWRINNGHLRLIYPGNHDLDVELYDYHFRQHRTRLYFTINGTLYQLNKLSDFYHDDWYWWDHDHKIMRNRDSYYHYMTWAQYNMAKSREGGVSNVENKSQNPELFRFGRDFSKVKPAGEE